MKYRLSYKTIKIGCISIIFNINTIKFYDLVYNKPIRNKEIIASNGVFLLRHRHLLNYKFIWDIIYYNFNYYVLKLRPNYFNLKLIKL